VINSLLKTWPSGPRVNVRFQNPQHQRFRKANRAQGQISNCSNCSNCFTEGFLSLSQYATQNQGPITRYSHFPGDVIKTLAAHEPLEAVQNRSTFRVNNIVPLGKNLKFDMPLESPFHALSKTSYKLGPKRSQFFHN